MDLPIRKHYGVMCARCESCLWTSSQREAELRLDVSFPDHGGVILETPMGVLIGYGRFQHVCRIESDILKER